MERREQREASAYSSLPLGEDQVTETVINNGLPAAGRQSFRGQEPAVRTVSDFPRFLLKGTKR